jgi:exodeoxyribonuclease (lambda-induced)
VLENQNFKLLAMEQGSDEWFHARAGKITASIFSKVVTRTGKPSASATEVINKAVAELVLGEPQEEIFQSAAMIRGNELEGDALDLFNFANGSKFEKCGFLDTERGYGCSPDGIDFVKQEGLELKCPLAHTHIGYLSGGKLPDKYFQQIQFSLMVTGFQYWNFGSYHPSLPVFCTKVGRDEAFIEKAFPILMDCVEQIKRKHVQILELI